MFTWIKVVRKLSQQENILDVLDTKMQDSSKLLEALNAAISKSTLQIQQIEDKIIDSQKQFTSIKDASQGEINALNAFMKKNIEEFESRMNSSKAEFAQLNGQLDTYVNKVHQHLESIKKAAQEHCSAINHDVKSYENSVSKLGNKLTELGNAIAEFQR